MVLAPLGLPVGLLIWRFAFAPSRQSYGAALGITGLAVLSPFLVGTVDQSGTLAHGLATLWMWIALALAICDLRVRRLPDVLTAPLFAIALGYAAVAPMADLRMALVSATVGVAVFGALRWGYRLRSGRDGLGLGDVKLMAGLAAMVGIEHLAWVSLTAAVSAIATTLALVRLRVQDQSALAELEMPFGTYLCAAAAVVWLMPG